MNSWFATLSIRSKLILIILTVIFVIMTLVGGIRIAWDVQQDRQTLLNELSALNRLLGNRSSAALVFDDALLAQENLASLQELPHITQSCLYRQDNSVLAEYRRDHPQNKELITGCPAINQIENEQSHFKNDHLHISTAIKQGPQTIGWIYLRCNLSPIKARTNEQITFSVIALLAAVLCSWLLAAWLQRLISNPIVAVTKIARRIEEHGEQNLRAPVQSNDEVGQLARGFNAMLDTLEAQNQQLLSAKSEQQIASARFQSLVESTSAIPWELDLTTWRFIFVGHQAEVVFGYPVADWYKENFLANHLHPDDRDDSIAFCRAAAAKMQNYQFEYRMLAADGRIVWIHDDIQVITENGEPVRLQGFMFDISTRKKMEEELRHHHDELEDLVEQRTIELQTSNKELESFSYSISHDLRAPLRSISGFSQIILDDYSSALDAEGQGLLTRVVDNTRRMSELIDDLLELSRLRQKTLNTMPVDFDMLVAEVEHSLQDHNNRRKVEFTCEPLGTVIADQSLLKVVIENLLGNAWKYTSKIDHARIEMGKQREQNETVYYIKDNGAGFNMDYVNKIFGAFQRLHKHEDFEGTGIGLATVQRIIQRHGGRIWAEAEIDKGAIFYFTLTRENS